MNDPTPKYYNDNGSETNPDLIPKPSLCIICKKDGEPVEENLCNLTRADQQGNLPDPDVIAAEIVENLEAALELFGNIEEELEK